MENNIKDHDWPDIPDTPEQRAHIAAHNAEVLAKSGQLRDLDAFHAHEALHAAHIAANVFSDNVRDAAFVEAHPDLIALCDTALAAIMDVYQAIGEKA